MCPKSVKFGPLTWELPRPKVKGDLTLDPSNPVDLAVEEISSKCKSESRGEVTGIPWKGTTDKIYRSGHVVALASEDRIKVLNRLIHHLAGKPDYKSKVPILLIMLGLLIDALPNEPIPAMPDEKVDENAEYLRSLGLIEAIGFKTIVVLLNAVCSDCYA